MYRNDDLSNLYAKKEEGGKGEEDNRDHHKSRPSNSHVNIIKSRNVGNTDKISPFLSNILQQTVFKSIPPTISFKAKVNFDIHTAIKSLLSGDLASCFGSLSTDDIESSYKKDEEDGEEEKVQTIAEESNDKIKRLQKRQSTLNQTSRMNVEKTYEDEDEPDMNDPTVYLYCVKTMCEGQTLSESLRRLQLLRDKHDKFKISGFTILTVDDVMMHRKSKQNELGVNVKSKNIDIKNKCCKLERSKLMHFAKNSLSDFTVTSVSG